MTKSLPQKTHAETLIKVTEEYTLRPKTGDRAQVCIATLQYLLDNFSYSLPCDHMDEFYARMYGAGSAVDTDDIENLIMELKALK
jgi:hypothetical protein